MVHSVRRLTQQINIPFQIDKIDSIHQTKWDNITFFFFSSAIIYFIAMAFWMSAAIIVQHIIMCFGYWGCEKIFIRNCSDSWLNGKLSINLTSALFGKSRNSENERKGKKKQNNNVFESQQCSYVFNAVMYCQYYIFYKYLMLHSQWMLKIVCYWTRRANCCSIDLKQSMIGLISHGNKSYFFFFLFRNTMHQ